MDIRFRVRNITNGFILSASPAPTEADPLAQRGLALGEAYHPDERAVADAIARVLAKEAQSEAETTAVNNPR